MTDQTGLTGTFDFTLEWAPDRSELDQPADGAADPAGPSFEQALREQLGIRLQRRRSPVNVPVVDHVERPSAN